MNPIKLSQQLQDTLVSYLTTTFDVNRDGREAKLAKFIHDSLDEPRALFAGPYLELTAPYKTGQSLQRLAAEGILNPALLQLPCFQKGKPIPTNVPLYQHQEQAIRKLCAEGRNIVVSSGTGSGKTESFLIPLLNNLVSDPTPGVRAVLIYPLNALVNDQLDRLRTLLQGTEITFGRYTSELAHDSQRAAETMKEEWREDTELQKRFPVYPLPNEVIGRDQIRTGKLLPQILITNYAMLEYLLLRPQDNPLFASGRWQFAVLDEAHSYAGAKGIEVGLLMRRLKQRLGHTMQCIATSATLTDDDAREATEFAHALFGEKFEAQDIIFGQTDKDYHPVAIPRAITAKAYLHPQFEKLLKLGREHANDEQYTADCGRLLHQIGLSSSPPVGHALTPAQLLWQELPGNEDLILLRQIMEDQGQPVEVKAVAEELFGDRLSNSADQYQAIHHLIELAAIARPTPDDASLLPARYHLFVRPPQGVWACLNPHCPHKPAAEQWSKLFATPRQTCDSCGCAVYPIVVCRTCGQVYVRFYHIDRQYLAEQAPSGTPVRPEDRLPKQYATWKPLQDNLSLADEEEEEEVLERQEKRSGGSKLGQVEFRLCLNCQQQVNRAGGCGCQDSSEQVVAILHLLNSQETSTRKGVLPRHTPVDHLYECGRCHSTSLKKNSEIVTEISIGDLSPLVNLTEALYRALPESTDTAVRQKAGGGRKLLSFYDSRQRAARFAAYVQDVVNQKGYRSIIYEALQPLRYWPDFADVVNKMLALALQHRILHNDVTLDEQKLPQEIRKLSQSQKNRLGEKMGAYLTAEISTQLRSRIALESLGLLAVEYFAQGQEPDWEPLARQIQLSPADTRTLVHYLLDGLRRAKIITLPDGIARDHVLFGRNKFSPRIIHGGQANPHEVVWCGQTPRHGRRRLVEKVLTAQNLPNDEAAVKQTLAHIWEWLVEKTNLFDTSRPAEGYQLRHDQLFFHTTAQWYRCSECQRLSCRGDGLPCPHPNCTGTYRPFDAQDPNERNFYRDTLSQPPIPMRVEEHTAQLAPKQGREYQNQFKSGEVNMLSCSTTFEMGIDLGDLQAVIMSNIPPTVANYKQRAGRAGRRTSGTAFILAWAADRPHDQAYFKNPAEIISGRVRIPYLKVNNPIITQRHINALLLSHFLRYCAQMGNYQGHAQAFFEERENGSPYFDLIQDWLENHKTALDDEITQYVQAIQTSSETASAPIQLEQELERFAKELDEKGGTYYRERINYYEEEWAKIHQGMKPGQSSNDNRDLDRLNSLLTRQRKEKLIDFLSNRGFLPSYSFPLHTVELRLPLDKPEAEGLRLQRDLTQAIREYAPGQEVVANKRIWESAGLDFLGRDPQTSLIFAYYLCPTCRHLQLEEIAGKKLASTGQACPVCGSRPLRVTRETFYIQPDGFWASKDSGKAAGQFVDQPAQQIQSALVVPHPVDKVQKSTLLSVGYNRHGSLLYINEGPLMYQGSGFKICQKCGVHITHKEKRCKICGTAVRDEKYMLGFKQNTDTLHLQFAPSIYVLTPDHEKFWSFWTSLAYALIQGASHALQIERRDIGAVLYPEQDGSSWRPTVVLYDNVPGGAGHVKQIEEEMLAVVTAALEILDCDCEKSCYRCLREYSNQYEHHLLDRNPVQTFLTILGVDLQGQLEGAV